MRLMWKVYGPALYGRDFVQRIVLFQEWQPSSKVPYVKNVFNSVLQTNERRLLQQQPALLGTSSSWEGAWKSLRNHLQFLLLPWLFRQIRFLCKVVSFLSLFELFYHPDSRIPGGGIEMRKSTVVIIGCHFAKFPCISLSSFVTVTLSIRELIFMGWHAFSRLLSSSTASPLPEGLYDLFSEKHVLGSVSDFFENNILYF